VNRHGWSVRYPPSWQAAAVAAASPEEEFQPILTGPKDCYEGGQECGLVQLGTGPGLLTRRQSALSPKDAVLENFADSRFVLRQQGNTSLGGQPAYYVVYRIRLYESYPNGTIFKRVQTRYRNRAYFIACNEEGKNRSAISAIESPDSWALNATFEAIVASFRFTAR
jgi:hypothetical protein